QAGLGPAVTDAAVAEQIEIQARYAGYIDRQRAEVETNRRHENTPLPVDFDYAVVNGLSAEVRQKLERVRPATLGQAARIDGMTPAAISLLRIYLKKHTHLKRSA
ncbi:MAG TPA: tRNA uridine-5-carboxymethylaminomethyl(34) synthesis enzyme MnmG, partial [Gammaproteobacteria bacterium]|nr:tRNA uridine-5-carboxymethylaminomethyl(34) synthesis enzyme MnmG [Gammaproteobacteria bacterium]